MAEEENEQPEAEAAADAPREAAEEAADAPTDTAEDSAGDAPRDAAEEAADVPAEASEPVEQLHPKERRKKARAVHSGEALPERSPEERAAERNETRSKKAASRSRYRKAQRAKKTDKGTGTPAADRDPGTQKTRQGIVVSDKAEKTITVEIQSARRHPAYEKVVRRSNKLTAHDERNEAGTGDVVRIVETRPLSKTKHWRLVEIVEKAR